MSKITFEYDGDYEIKKIHKQIEISGGGDNHKMFSFDRGYDYKILIPDNAQIKIIDIDDDEPIEKDKFINSNVSIKVKEKSSELSAKQLLKQLNEVIK